MRIVGGELRGRPLAAPRSDAIRPTTDRTRESLFNILSHRYPEALCGTRVLDLFSGTGALGIEALSRGASFCLFIEESVEGRALLRDNIEALGLQGRTKVFRRDATRLGDAGTIAPFDLVMADPPYGRGLGEAAFASAIQGGWVKPGAILVLEEEAEAMPALDPRLEVIDERRFGGTFIRLLCFSNKP